MIVYSDHFSKDTLNKFTEIMLSEDSFFISRLGGSDFDIVNSYYLNHNEVLLNYTQHINTLGQFNGYFDCTDNKQANLRKYLDILIETYYNAKYLTYANGTLIKFINNGCFPPTQSKFLEYICKDKMLFNYTFIEGIHLFLQSFKIWAENKRILIISPLSKSIWHQYPKRDTLFNNGYIFPNFELSTYNTHITYSTVNNTKQSLKITTNNWHEELSSMIGDIEKLDFDIALISCGSYTNAVGDYISQIMNKKSIYLGGTLNVMWNIYGERYNNEYVNSIVNSDTEINPLENEDIKHIVAGRSTANESLRAYFGERK